MKKFLPYILITIPIVIGGLYGLESSHARRIEQERAKTAVAVEAVQHALQIAQAHQDRARTAEERADSIAASRRQRAPARAAVVAAAPDTCAPAIAVLEADKQDLESELGNVRQALEDQKKATAVLTPAAEQLADAAEDLSDAAGGSFWRDITPDVGFGVTAGMSPITGRADVLIGITLSY